jgi:hypothetical protein
MSNPTYLTENEVSKITKRAVPTLRSDRHRNIGIPYRKVGRKVLYRLDEVFQFIESHKIEPENY